MSDELLSPEKRLELETFCWKFLLKLFEGIQSGELEIRRVKPKKKKQVSTYRREYLC